MLSMTQWIRNVRVGPEVVANRDLLRKGEFCINDADVELLCAPLYRAG